MANRSWVLGAILAACGGADTPGPTSEDFALAADGLTSIDTEASVVAAIELSLSGDFVVPEPQMDGEPHEVTLARIAKASVTFAKNLLGECLKSDDPPANVVMHELVGCTIDGRSVTGDVVTTFGYVDSVDVEHVSENLQIDGRAIRLSSTVDGYFEGENQTRRRVLQMTVDGGQTVAGSWVAVLDNTGCGTRDGTSTVAFEDALLHRVDAALRWCGDGTSGTLIDGTVQLVRGASAVRLEFLGNDQVTLDGDDYTLDSTISELRD